MNTHSKIDTAATRRSPTTTARRGASTAARSGKQQLLLAAMALVAGTYAFGVNTAAQADTIRHNFCTATCPSDGWQPEASLMLGSNGKLYGTAEFGGTYGKGTVYWIKPNGTGYATKYSFGTIASDGAYPFAGLLQSGSLVYGTTYEGGANNFGTVFCMQSSVTAELSHYSFGSSATDGTYPQAGLTRVGNWLYGTTVHGGANGAGTVFRINTKCGQEQVLYSFAGGTDGAWPSGTLYYDSTNHLLYGTTQLGGAGCNCGTVFSVTTAGAESVVYSFTGNPDGGAPRGGVVLDAGTGLLFGTTEYGGQSLGTVFSISPTCNNSCGAATVYPFKGPTNSPPDGLYPYSNLIDVSGTLYGTTLYGGSGTGCGANGCGTVFSVNASTFSTPNETPVYSFTGAATDGYAPSAGVLAIGPVLYGTTTSGGSKTTCGDASGCGTVFSVP